MCRRPVKILACQPEFVSCQVAVCIYKAIEAKDWLGVMICT